MLLRNSISNTKKFFQKTVDNVKSFLSKGSTTYERLPKTPPFRPFSCGRDTSGHTHTDGGAAYHNTNTELDHFYTEFTHQWDNSRKSKLKNRAQKIKSSIRASSSSTRKSQQFYSFDHSSAQENCSFAAGTNDSMKTPEKNADIFKGKRLNVRSTGIMQYSDLCSKSVRERRLSYVAEKLKEFENMDKGNTDHKRDVEEFLHCYSRLTCPAYLDIVDKFLKEMSAEFFCPHQASPKGNYSTPLWKAVKV